MGNTRMQPRATRVQTPSRLRRPQPAPTTRSWGRTQSAPKQGGGAKKGLLLAAAPVVGSFLMKKMRERQQTKKNTVVVETDRTPAAGI